MALMFLPCLLASLITSVDGFAPHRRLTCNQRVGSTIFQCSSPVTSRHVVTESSSAVDLGYLSSYKYETLSTDPLIYIVNDVLSEEECQRFIDRANNASPEEMTRSNPPEVSLDISKLWPLIPLCLGAGIPPMFRLVETDNALTIEKIIQAAAPPILIAAIVASGLAVGVTNMVRIQSDSKSRTSDALALNTEKDFDLCRDLISRVCSISGNHPWSKFEAPVLTRYQTGAIFATHNDASPTLGSEWSDLGGQRVVTAIMYLNDCPKGGATYFDRFELAVQPKRGSALVFFPADAKTLKADDRTRHESLEAVEEKYIVQMFGRVNRVPPPLGLPASFSNSPDRMEN